MIRTSQAILWFVIWGIITTYSIFLPKNIYIFHRYQIDVNINKDFISNIRIHNTKNSNYLSGTVKAENSDIFRLEFDPKNIKNKILSVNLKWSGSIEWYFLWDTPFLNCKSRIISENQLCEKDYRQFYRASQLFKIIQSTWIARQNIVGISKNKFSDIVNIENEKSLDYFELIWKQRWYDYSIAHFLYELIWKNSNLYKKFAILEYPNSYSRVYLDNGENYVFFDPYDLFFTSVRKPDKIWYIIHLSWWSELNYNLIDDPILKTDHDRLDSIKNSYD